jgi:hypothetical protein
MPSVWRHSKGLGARGYPCRSNNLLATDLWGLPKEPVNLKILVKNRTFAKQK